jgi:hypothetical protein
VGSKTIEREFPGRSAGEIYVELEKVIRSLSAKFGLRCDYHPASHTITVPEKLGVKGSCQASDGRASVTLSHGLLGGPIAAKAQDYIEREMKKLFSEG